MDKKIIIEKMNEPTKKTIKTFPKGVLKKTEKLKLKGVRDPAKSPPLKKGMRTHTLRLLTSKGMKKHRRTQRKILGRLNDLQITKLGKDSGLIKNEKVPAAVARQIVDAGMQAGFVSV